MSVTTVPGSSTRWPVKQIELTAAWDGANGRRVLSFATYVSDRLATSAHSGAGYTEGEGTVASGETLQGDGTAATIYESMNTAAEGTTSTASGAGEAYTAPPETTTSSTTTSSAASTSSATSSSATSTNPNGKPTGKKK